MNQTYRNFELLIVDDGSKDKTKKIGKTLAKKFPEIVSFYSKPNEGKASALNYGILQASGEIVVSIDADSMFLRDTLRKLVLSFCDPEIVAVGGNVKVANREKILNKHQALEYITGLNLQRRTFAWLDCMQVISGAIGAFRKKELLTIGGYSSDTIVEDMDVTISLARYKHKIEYNSKAMAYTEAPEKIRDFLKQRSRWTLGGFQVLKKHRDLIFNPRFGKLGLIGMPYFMIFPWIDVLISVLLVFTVLRVAVVGNIDYLALFYLAISSLQAGLTYYSLRMDQEDKRLTLLSLFESLWYSHLISFVIIKAGLYYLKGSPLSWNKLPRLGKNYAPAT